MQLFNIKAAHPSWHECIEYALTQMDKEYLITLYNTEDWLPGHHNIFNAFSLSLNETKYILFGESPYPRSTSANGYAFWDANVNELWSQTGLSKPVNRATSFRNILKMLLIAEDALNPNEITQSDIAKLNKNNFITTNTELFQNFLAHGFLLLNTTLVLRTGKVTKDALAWNVFIKHLLKFILENKPDVQLILLGNVANSIEKLVAHLATKRICAEHPYNISFIHNQKMINFFKPFHLLRKTSS